MPYECSKVKIVKRQQQHSTQPWGTENLGFHVIADLQTRNGIPQCPDDFDFIYKVRFELYEGFVEDDEYDSSGAANDEKIKESRIKRE